jgi:hypothetical protein
MKSADPDLQRASLRRHSLAICRGAMPVIRIAVRARSALGEQARTDAFQEAQDMSPTQRVEVHHAIGRATSM